MALTPETYAALDEFLARHEANRKLEAQYPSLAKARIECTAYGAIKVFRYRMAQQKLTRDEARDEIHDMAVSGWISSEVEHRMLEMLD